MLRVDLVSLTSYVVQGCAVETTIVLDPIGPDPNNPPAIDWDITVQLYSYSTACSIIVPSASGVESSISILFTAPAGATYLSSVQQITS